MNADLKITDGTLSKRFPMIHEYVWREPIFPNCLERTDYVIAKADNVAKWILPILFWNATGGWNSRVDNNNKVNETLIGDVTKKFGLFKNMTIWRYAPCDHHRLIK